MALSLNPRVYRNLDDVDSGIESMALALSLASDDHPLLPLLLTRLGEAHNQRYAFRGDPNDIETAIELTSLVLARTPDDDPSVPSLLDTLGTAHAQRFQQSGDMDDLEKSIEYNSITLALTPDGHPSFSRRIGNIGALHGNRFLHLGHIGDLEKAIEYATRGLDLTLDIDLNLPSMLSNLGSLYETRFECLGDLDDLDKAVGFQSRALSLTPHGDPKLSGRLSGLGICYKSRFQRTGALDELEKAVDYEYRALASTPVGHPELSDRLANLAVSHNYRFQRLGELSDLEKAIEHGSHGLAITPSGHPSLSSQLANLGLFYKNRFQRTQDSGDLDRAIDHQSRALALTPDGNRQLARRLANLGVFHNYRFHHLGNLVDLETAIEYQSRAIALTPEGHPDLPLWLANQGSCHSNRFHHLGELGDLDKAIEYEDRALALTPDGHPDTGSWSFNHALSYGQYYEHTDDPSHVHKSLKFFRIACHSLTAAPRVKFWQAQQWARHASQHSPLNSIEAYQTTIDLLPQFIWLGATTDQRYEDLRTAETLAVDAASAAIKTSDFALALEWLEHARCVVWNQSLMLQSPLDELQYSHPALATRLQSVASQLQSAGSESRESRALSSGSMTIEQVAQEHRQLAKEYNNLLSEVRLLPGFEDFLQPIKANRLVNAAQNGPVILINCHESRCDALVIQPFQENINHIPLPNFNGKKARHARSELELSLENNRLRERGVQRRPMEEEGQGHGIGNLLAVLWDDVVKPILDSLGYMNNEPAESLPHITWCPTGAMSFLPLHAAGDYDQPRSRVFDYVISSYTPTLTSLLGSIPYSFGCTSRILAVGQPMTPGHTPLPGTVTELSSVEAHIKDRAQYSQLVGDKATTTAVLNEMEQHDWVHLACHAHQGVRNATESGFFLHDGVLDLASINRRSFKNKGLAFLSACQTATGDEKLPDEAIHLASGMVMAGYTSVIGTMWSVADSDAPLIADEVYKQLMQTAKLGSGEAGKALHKAVAILRERVGEWEFERWVPYIHIGSGLATYQLDGPLATVDATLNAMENHSWVHLACHATQNRADPSQSAFHLHDGKLTLATIIKRAFKNKGLALLSACQTATGDDELPDEATYLAAGMLMAGYPSVIATMWSIMDEDVPEVAEVVYAELMQNGKMDHRNAPRALHKAVEKLREKVGLDSIGGWASFVHIGA